MRLIQTLMITLSMLLMASGCLGAQAGDAEEWLSQAISGLMGEDDFAFTGKTKVEMSDAQLKSTLTFSGKVNDHNEIYIQSDDQVNRAGYTTSALQVSGELTYTKVNRRWTVTQSSDKQLHPLFTLNPIIHAEHLNRSARDVVIDAEAAAQDGTVVLRASVDQAGLTDEFRKLIRAEHEEVIAKVQAEAREADNELLAEELAQSVLEAEERLSQILSTLQVDPEYRVVMDKRSRRLLELTFHAELQYRVDDEPHKESIQTSYQFEI